MRQNLTQFGREIRFGDIQKGQTILLYDQVNMKLLKGKVTTKPYGEEFGTFQIEDSGKEKVFFDYDKIWLVEELSIAEVDSIRLSQKPFAIQSDNTEFLSKRAPDSGPPHEEHFTMFPSMSKSFSSFTEAAEYLQKYLTASRNKVVLLQKRA